MMFMMLEKLINRLQSIEDKITGESSVYIRFDRGLYLIDDISIETIDELRTVVIDVYSDYE